MKRILCYGDSNTWGTIADGTCMHCDLAKAYPAILQKLLGKDYQVISEGMPSRTTNVDDFKFPKGNRNGAFFFPQCVITHDPLDYVVLFLGTNDLKPKFNRSVKDIVDAIEKDYILFTRNNLKPELTRLPKFVIVCPSVVDETKFEGFEGATAKSKMFDREYRLMAKNNSCLYVSNDCLQCGDDGIHLNEQSHKKLAEQLSLVIKQDD